MIEVGSRVEYFEDGVRYTGTVADMYFQRVAFITWDDGDPDSGIFVEDLFVIDG